MCALWVLYLWRIVTFSLSLYIYTYKEQNTKRAQSVGEAYIYTYTLKLIHARNVYNSIISHIIYILKQNKHIYYYLVKSW